MIYWISNKATIFSFSDMKYQRPWCSGHGSVPKTMSLLSNLLRPIRLRKPNSASALETGNALMDTMGTILLYMSYL